MKEYELRRAIMRIPITSQHTMADKLTLLAIKDCVSWETHCGLITTVQLSDMLGGIPKRTIQRALKKLHKAGLIRRDKRQTCINVLSVMKASLEDDTETLKGDMVSPLDDMVSPLDDMVSPLEGGEGQGDMVSLQGDMVSLEGDMVSLKGDMVSPITSNTINNQLSSNTDARATEDEPTDWAAKMEEEKQKEREYYRTRPPKRPELNKMQLALIDGAIIAGQIADTIYARNQYAVKMFGIELLEVQERRRRKRTGL
jgi:predicted transcriptional regulator